MVAVPPVTPLTVPVLLTVATAEFVLLHVPPATDAVRVVAEPAHTLEAPLMAAVTGAALTVMALVAEAVPQLPEIEYVMVVLPAPTPVTTPVEETVATPGAELTQVPPAADAVNAVVAPEHTVEA